MNSIDEEYKKGFQLGLAGKEQSELFLDTINMFRSDEEKRARQRGYEAGLKEQEFRKRGLR
jgi:ribosome modulation factor